MEDLFNNIDEVLIKLPNKIVAEDIKNFLTKKKNKHLFSDIYNERTLINPNSFIKYTSNLDIISLYEGGTGLGTYLRVVYSIKENKYIFYTINQFEDPVENFKSENWLEFYLYVCKKLFDIFIWFNKEK